MKKSAEIYQDILLRNYNNNIPENLTKRKRELVMLKEN